VCVCLSLSLSLSVQAEPEGKEGKERFFLLRLLVGKRVKHERRR